MIVILSIIIVVQFIIICVCWYNVYKKLYNKDKYLYLHNFLIDQLHASHEV